MKVPEIVKSYMQEYDLSLTDIGAAFGVTRQAVYYWTLGEMYPSSMALARARRISGWPRELAEKILDSMTRES